MENGALNNSPLFGAAIQTHRLTRINARSFSFIERMVITIDRIPNLPDEEWRAIEGYKGKYLVSNCGRVKSLKHANARLLTAFPNNKGYLRVCLCRNGKGRHFLVSRLVAAAFCENDDP